jgi:dGTPase
MSSPVFDAMAATREFLFERVYLGRVVPETARAVERILVTLLDHFAVNPPPEGPPASDPGDARLRAVDYVAGMTDRFAIRRVEELTGVGFPQAALG